MIWKTGHRIGFIWITLTHNICFGCDLLHLKVDISSFLLGVCDTANFGIDPIPSKYRASIADTDSDTCHLKIHTFK